MEPVPSQAKLMELFQKPEVWLILITAASEIIGMSKMKENSVIQLMLSFLKSAAARSLMKKACWKGYEKRGTKQKGGKPSTTASKRNQRQEKVVLYLFEVGSSSSAL